MGVDLTLHVIDLDNSAVPCAHTRMRLERDYDLWELIETANAIEVARVFPAGVSGFYRDEYGAALSDPYGQPLKFVEAGRLIDIGGCYKHPHQLNEAAFRYLRAVPWATKVILYWH